MKRLLLAAVLCLFARPAAAQLGTVQALGPYQPSMFTPRYTYYNPNAQFYGVPDYSYYGGPVFIVPAYDPYFYPGAQRWQQRRRGW